MSPKLNQGLKRDHTVKPPTNRLAAFLSWLLEGFNQIALKASMVAMVFTSCILTYSVIGRYFLDLPTDWQDEISVFLLIGVIFFCAAYVQSLRGHIAIEALTAVLTPKWNRRRLFFVDLISLIFCTFFSWKSWKMVYEAVQEGQETATTLSLPLWISYSMMALGMSFLSLQIFVQIILQMQDNKKSL